MPKITSHIRKWSGGSALTEEAIRNLMHTEGLQPFVWSGRPRETYHLCTLPYHRVIWVVEGSITFNLPNEERQLTLRRGDRLDLPPRVIHRAVAGLEGLLCLEAHHQSPDSLKAREIPVTGMLMSSLGSRFLSETSDLPG